MKKRLLALILCLVMMTSLLPLTAAALGKRVFKSWNMDGTVEQYDDGIHYILSIDNITFRYNDTTEVKTGGYYSEWIATDPECTQYITDSPVEGTTYYVKYAIMFSEGYFETEWDDSFTANLEIPGYETKCIGKNAAGTVAPWLSFYFSLTKKHEHAWQFTQTDSTLTAACRNCSTAPVSVTLKADSVTLPNSPFNARLEGWESFRQATGAEKGEFVYKYNGPNGWSVVEPTAANAKAGEYQVGVYLWDITRGPIDPSEGTYLYVKYTAADPAITAQTGDNRPIELMMAGVAVFSALAAAAFILDSKRRYHR